MLEKFHPGGGHCSSPGTSIPTTRLPGLIEERRVPTACGSDLPHSSVLFSKLISKEFCGLQIGWLMVDSRETTVQMQLLLQ